MTKKKKDRIMMDILNSFR